MVDFFERQGVLDLVAEAAQSKVGSKERDDVYAELGELVVREVERRRAEATVQVIPDKAIERAKRAGAVYESMLENVRIDMVTTTAVCDFDDYLARNPIFSVMLRAIAREMAGKA